MKLKEKLLFLHGKHLNEKLIDFIIFLSENKDMNEIDIIDYMRDNNIKGVEQWEMMIQLMKFTSNFFTKGFSITKFKNLTPNIKKNPDQLSKGIQVEYEHTTLKTISRKISLDHLAEISDYYDRLKKMEDESES